MSTRDLIIPQRMSNAPGNWPDSDKFMSDFDFLTAIVFGSFIQNGGEETWVTTSFASPANDAALNSQWLCNKSGTTSPTFTIAREGTTVHAGTYAKKYNFTVAGSANSITGDYQSVANVSSFAGYTIVFGRYVLASNANKVRLRVNDGTTTTYSSYHSGNGSWALLTVKAAIPVSATTIKCYLDVTSDFTGAVYSDDAFLYVVPSLISDTAIASLNYHPRFETLNNSYLPLAGGTMAGAIAMASSKITGLAAGTTNGDALRYEQLVGVYLLLAGGTMAGNIAMGGNKVTGLAAATANGDAVRYEQMPTVSGTILNGSSASLSFGGFTTPTSSCFQWRFGDTLYIEGWANAAAFTATNVSIGLPGVLAIDSAKLGSSTNRELVGTGFSIQDASIATNAIFYDGSDTAKVYMTNSNDSSNQRFIKRTASSYFGAATATTITFQFSVPISGWSI